MTSTTKNDKSARIKEEFRLLIIPLMQNAVNDNPSDLVSYCARYFEDLLIQREEKNKIRENKRSKDAQSLNTEGSKNPSSHQKTQIQNSASLPILTQNDPSFGPLLRETSSWSNPSDSTQKAHRRNIQFDVVDVMSQIGDQPDQNKEFQKKGDGDLHKNKEITEIENMICSGGDEMKKDKNEEFKSDKETRNPPDILSNAASSHSEDIDMDLCALVNTAFSATCSKPSNSRKKWAIDDIFESQPEITPVLSPPLSDSSSSGSDDSPNLYQRFRDVTDGQFVSKKNSSVEASASSSFGSTSQLDIEKMSQSENSEGNEVQPKDDKGKTTPEKQALSVEDVESFAQSIFKTLRKNLEKEIQTAESELYLKLQSLKPANATEASASQSPMPLRKKRSITTISTSDTFCKAEHTSKERDKIPNDKTLLLGCKNKAPELNSQLKPDRRSEFISKESRPNRDAVPETKPETMLKISKDALHSNQQNVEPRMDAGTETEPCKSKKKKDLPKNEGIVNPGFSMEDDLCSDQSFMKRISFIHQKFENAQRCAKNQVIRQKTFRTSGNLPNHPLPIGRLPQPFRYSARPSIYLTPIVPNTGISNIGEGDAPPPRNQKVCSVGTETDNSRTNERSANTGCKVARILPILDTASQSSRHVSGENAGSTSIVVEERGNVPDNSTASIDNSSKRPAEAEQTNTNKTHVDETLVKREKAVQEPNPLPKSSHDVKEIATERKKTESNTNVTKKKSNLNPCAPVFSPNARSFGITMAQPSIASRSSERIFHSDNKTAQSSYKTQLYNLMPQNDNRIDAIAWDRTKSEKSPGHKDIPPSNAQNRCSETQKRSRDFGNESTSKSEKSEPILNCSTSCPALVKGIKHSGALADQGGAQIRKSQIKTTGGRTSLDTIGTQGKTEAKFKQNEPCLNPASGDFVPIENDSDRQSCVQNESKVSEANSSNALPSQTRPVSGSENLSKVTEKEPEEEIELNFSCLSDSDSSDCYSSDGLSDEDY